MRLRIYFNLTAAISTICSRNAYSKKNLRYSKLKIIINKYDIMLTFS